MNTTNLSPPIKGPVQQTAEALEENLLRPWRKICGKWRWRSIIWSRKARRPRVSSVPTIRRNWWSSVMPMRPWRQSLPAWEQRTSIGPWHHQYHPLRTSWDWKPQFSQQNLRHQVHLHLGYSEVLPCKKATTGEWSQCSNQGHGGGHSKPRGGNFGWTTDSGSACSI